MAFCGTSENAVKPQVWITFRIDVLVAILVAIIKKRFGAGASLYTILKILGLMLPGKNFLILFVTNLGLQPAQSQMTTQLDLFG